MIMNMTCLEYKYVDVDVERSLSRWYEVAIIVQRKAVWTFGKVWVVPVAPWNICLKRPC